ncbi:MAG: adenylate kinase [Acidobacteria bacterium]|nr:adenylate kinase [Acidobacteriota bacterium]
MKANKPQPLHEPLIFLGAPGAGKGTQAREICSRLGIPHISTGDILRANATKQTPLGLLAKASMDRGELVSDEVINEMVRDRLSQPDCQNGFLLDGYPRTLAQAEALGALLQERGYGTPIVVNLRVGYNIVVKRLGGRRICPVCQRTYNVNFHPPLRDGVCDADGSPLQQRADDREEAIRERLLAYEAQTAPLIEFYKKGGRFFDIDGEQEPEQITGELARLLEVQ